MMEEYELKPLINLYYEFYQAINKKEAPSLELHKVDSQESINPFKHKSTGFGRVKSIVSNSKSKIGSAFNSIMARRETMRQERKATMQK